MINGRRRRRRKGRTQPEDIHRWQILSVMIGTGVFWMAVGLIYLGISMG